MEMPPGYFIAIVEEYLVLCLFLLLLFVVFVRSYRGVSKQYSEACSLIKKIHAPLISNKDINPKDTKSLFLEAISDTSLRYLKECVFNYTPGFRYGDNISTHVGIEKFFNLQAIKNESISEEFIGFSKSVCISVGVLGTFLGLVLGIRGAATGLASTDANLARLALEELLSGAGIAFITSLAGLFCALIIARTVAHREFQLESVWRDFKKDYLVKFPYQSVEMQELFIIRDKIELIGSTIDSFYNDFNSAIGLSNAGLSELNKNIRYFNKIVQDSNKRQEVESS